jgi:hypothetical protein
MRAVYWSCIAIVSVVLGDAVGCGGRVMVADCGQGRQYCAETNVCCPNFTTCGDDKNGCPAGSCCLNTTSHIVDGGSDDGGDASDSALTPADLPPADMAPGSVPPNTNPGNLPGTGGGRPPLGGKES